MKITNSTIQQYTLPLSTPLMAGATSIITREGIVLTVHSETGLRGHGEIAPLPGLHQESLAEATEQLLKYRLCLSEITLSHDLLLFDGYLQRALPSDLLPSLRSGIEMAIFDLLLADDPAPNNLPRSLPVNALLFSDKHRTEQVNELLLQGFTSIKIKVGRQTVDNDIKDISEILSMIRGKASLRLDANRRWTLEEAKRFCGQIDPQDIEYIEEPTQCPEDLVHLCQCNPIPIALDETLVETACDQLDEKCCSAVILKPALLGGFDKTAHIVRWAKQYRILPVISSTFQTSLTTRMYLYFAASNQITQTPLGLDTGKWFREDLLSNPCLIENGHISLACLTTRPKLRQDFLNPLEEGC